MEIEELYAILLSDKPSEMIRLNEDEIFNMIKELRICKGFNQNNIWHVYDVYEHILHVVDYVPKDIILRLAALFHDIGKPFSYSEDEQGIGHFKGHWIESKKIFDSFATKYKINDNDRKLISDLILYHDYRIEKMMDNEIKEIIDTLGEKGIKMLYQLKKADLLSQNSKYHYLLDEYDNQEKELLKKYCKVL